LPPAGYCACRECSPMEHASGDAVFYGGERRCKIASPLSWKAFVACVGEGAGRPCAGEGGYDSGPGGGGSCGGAEIRREEEEAGVVVARSGATHPTSTSPPELLPPPSSSSSSYYTGGVGDGRGAASPSPSRSGGVSRSELTSYLFASPSAAL
jgi:hypothetical protein